MTTAIVLPCPAAVAAGLALPAGLRADDLHVTLACLLDDAPATTVRGADLVALVEGLAAKFAPVGAVLSGVGRFSGEELDALHLTVDGPGLVALRVAVVEALEAYGFTLDTAHGFDPHLTLAYLDHAAPTPLPRIEPVGLVFDRLAVWAGDVRTSAPFVAPGAVAMHRAAPPGAQLVQPVAFSASPVDDTAAGVWNVLAYEVSMKASGVTLTRADFEACVRNFAAYPKAPIVIEHADTHGGPAEWAEPHGWVAALRVGLFTRPDGRVVASLEGLTQPDPATRDAMRSAPGKPAKWPFGSVTVFQGRDEETDRPLGMCLWSFSLTAHPRLTDVPRLAASLASDSHASRGAAAQETPMKTFLALAAMFGIAASTEEDAEKKLEAFAAQGADDARITREALKLSATAPRADVLGAITALSTAAAKVPALETQVVAFAKAEAARKEADTQAHVDAYIAANPEQREESRAALEAFARADYAAFSTKYPKPSQAEQVERAKDKARFSKLPGGKGAAPAPSEQGAPVAHDLIAAANALVTDSDGTVSFSEALDLLTSGGPLPAHAAASEADAE